MRSGRLYTRDEVADILHVSYMTVRRLGRAGDLDEHRVSPQRIRITGESVDRHLAASRVAPLGLQDAAASTTMNRLHGETAQDTGLTAGG